MHGIYIKINVLCCLLGNNVFMRAGTVPRNLFGKTVLKIRLCVPRRTSKGNIKMDLEIDGMSGLVDWIFMTQDSK
jgi:hypothetical protein